MMFKEKGAGGKSTSRRSKSSFCCVERSKDGDECDDVKCPTVKVMHKRYK